MMARSALHRAQVRWAVAGTLIPLVALLLVAPALHAASRAPVRAANGMVVTASPPASTVGVDIPRAGGNAVDAAVAVGFALAVTYPSAGNLGGGGFMIVHLADGGENWAIDYREKAPAAAHRDLYLDDEGSVVSGLSTDPSSSR